MELNTMSLTDIVRKTISGLALIGALALPSKAATNYIPVGGGINFQEYVNSASNGDTLVLSSGDIYYEGNYSIGKDLTVRSEGQHGFSLGTLKLYSNANVNLQNLSFNGGLDTTVLLMITNEANANISTCTFTRANNSIVSKSDGKLKIEKCSFPEASSMKATSIDINKISEDVNISLNYIGSSSTGIVVRGKDLGKKPKLHILNNRLYNCSKVALSFEDKLFVTNGYVANNIFKGNRVGINNPNNALPPNIRNNDFHGNVKDYTPEETNAPAFNKAESSWYSEQFFEEPKYVTQNNTTKLLPMGNLSSNGINIDGVTTWFNGTAYIGEIPIANIPSLTLTPQSTNIVLVATNLFQNVSTYFEASTNMSDWKVLESIVTVPSVQTRNYQPTNDVMYYRVKTSP